ncbi:hypothetical protein KIPB_010819, partial [Kipferlia bialata]|eukprot:g10819.t1
MAREALTTADRYRDACASLNVPADAVSEQVVEWCEAQDQ